ncbi:MAG: ABC transporter permease [Treponema sp.]|jgi:hypothetical protein|nr:ABC transporter permease [Treponema sp.]
MFHSTKIFVVTSLVLILCLGGLCVPACIAKWAGDLLLVLPKEINSPRIDINKIEDFIEADFLLTYEIPSSDRVSLSNGEYPVTLIGTNSCYSRILGLSMIEGSFFSARDWEGKQRQAVLNEKAAFDIFGSSRIVGNRFKIRNEVWLVAGVINDGNEDHCRIYVPSSIREGGADALMALTSGGIDEAYVKNSLKVLGIQEAVYNFFNFGTITNLLWERVVIILLLFLVLLFLSLLRPLAIKCKAAFVVLKEELERRYMGQILKENRKTILKPLPFVLGLTIFPVMALFLFLRLASICLPWQDIPSLALISRELFYPHLERLCDYELASCLLFFVSLAILGVVVVSVNILLKHHEQQ